MDYYYGYEFSGGDPFAGMGGLAALGGILALLLVVWLLAMAFTVLSYVLQSVGMYAIAKRRGIRNPWLSWLPVGNMWILGSISDQYQYVAKGKVRSRRKTLLGLNIAAIALSVIFSVASFAIGFAAGFSEDPEAVLAGLGLAVLLALPMTVIAIIAAVIQYIALYDLYTSCNPSNAAVFEVLSILFNVTLPFFIFFSRNKDLGMPQRKPAPEAVFEPAAAEAAEPAPEEAEASAPAEIGEALPPEE